ncbi:MAG: glycosyltransferase [Planctomycetota bacterium]
MRPQTVSIVAPIRNCQAEIVAQLDGLIRDIPRHGVSDWDLVIVDDGSQDQTVLHVARWSGTRDHVRLIRHPRPRGFEAAGQTGLERSSGDLVFIFDQNVRYSAEDFARLLEQVSSDDQILGAQLERRIRPVEQNFQRRLQLCGIHGADSLTVDRVGHDTLSVRLQVFRRLHLPWFASRGVPRPKLTRSIEEETRLLSRAADAHP